MKLKKKTKILILIIIVFLLFLFFRKHDYKIEYKIKDSNVYEEYNKKLDIHFIKVNYKNKEYDFIINDISRKKIVSNIDYYNKKNISCLNIKVKEKKTYPICYKNNTIIDINLLNDKDVNDYYKNKINIKEVNDKFNNINIYNYNSAKYLLWNYKGFNYLNSNKNKKIELLTDDLYNINIVETIDNYLLIADYNQKYTFNRFIIIDMKNGKVDKWNIDYDISADSYILGKYNKSIYLVDKKNQVEYEIVPYKKRIRIVGNKNKDGIIYNNEFKNISMKELVSEELSFKEKHIYTYVLKNNKLYLSLYNSNNQILVSNKENIKIIKQDNDEIYYLVDDVLYFYKPGIKEKRIMSNFEWNFNSDNMIFIYK